jgi:hypothetical protein
LDQALPLNREAATLIEKRRFRDEHAGAILDKLTEAQEEMRQFADAEGWRRKWVAAVKERSGAESVPYIIESMKLGENLVQQQKWIEAELPLREAFALLEREAPASLARFFAQSQLGSALLGQKRYAESESLLVDGFEGLKAREKQIPPPDRHRIVESGERVIQLYEAWGRPEKAAEWRTKLARPVGTKSES